MKRRMESDMILHIWNVFNTETQSSLQSFLSFFNNFNNFSWLYLVSSAEDILKPHVVYIVGISYVTFEYKRGLQNSVSLSFQSNETSDADAGLSHSTNIRKVPQFLFTMSTYCSFSVVLGTIWQHWVPHVANLSTNFWSAQISNISL